VVLARSLHSGVSLEVRTTEPGVQFYAAFKLNVPVPGIGGRKYGPFAGFCLETQIWPDAINHEGFPNAVAAPRRSAAPGNGLHLLEELTRQRPAPRCHAERHPVIKPSQHRLRGFFRSIFSLLQLVLNRFYL
jgi:hypothetical protein